MEETKTNDTVETTEATEPVETVSNEPVEETWEAPQSQEELDILLKSASNKAKTNILKDLGVNSIKEFKELQSTLDSKTELYANIDKERETHNTELESLKSENDKLTQTSILDKLNIQEEYRDDLTTLAQAKVTEDVTFKDAITEMVESKYKYAATKPETFKMGTEKSSVSEKNKRQAEMKRLQEL